VLSLALGALVGGVIARYADPALPLLLAAAILAASPSPPSGWPLHPGLAVAHGRGG